MLINREADIEARDDDGWTALHFAASYGYEAVVQMLIDRGANIEARCKCGVGSSSLRSPLGSPGRNAAANRQRC